MNEPIEAHEHEGVDAGAGRDDNEILDDLAPDIAERPVRQYEIRRRERYAEEDEEQVGHGEIDDENVGGRAHRRIRRDDHDDEAVADEAEQADYAEEDRHDDGDDSLDDDLVEVVLLLELVRADQAHERRRRLVRGHGQGARVLPGHRHAAPAANLAGKAHLSRGCSS